jgi:hypothetical protein
MSDSGFIYFCSAISDHGIDARRTTRGTVHAMSATNAEHAGDRQHDDRGSVPLTS